MLSVDDVMFFIFVLFHFVNKTFFFTDVSLDAGTENSTVVLITAEVNRILLILLLY